MASFTPFSAVEIEINSDCNLACAYCPNSLHGPAGRRIIPDVILEKLLGELGDLGFSGRISYDFYNEPLLHPDLTGVIARTRTSLPHCSIELYTNGTLLHEDVFKTLCESGVSRFIITRHFGAESAAPLDYLASLGASQKEKVLVRDHTDLSMTNRGGSVPAVGGPPCQLTACHIPSFLVLVTVDGDVLPCFEDYHRTLIMGNLRTMSLMEIWKSEKYRVFRSTTRGGARHLHRPCSKCNRTAVLPPQLSEALEGAPST